MAIRIQEYVPLRDKTTLKIGGAARYFVSVSTVESLAEAVSFGKEKKVPFFLLGGGSNVLVGDRGIEGLVIKLDIRGVEWQDGGESVLVIVGAGEHWDGLVAEAVKRGLWGIENLSGIPGTVGAAPIQNIGAYGAEIRDVLEWVEVSDTNSGEVRRLSNAECGFQYRDSIFKQKEWQSLIVTRVALRLKKNGVPNLKYTDVKNYFEKKPVPVLSEIRKAILEIRSKKFPDLRVCGTAGSFFKNPIIPKAQFDELKKKFPDLPGFPIDADKRGYGDTRINADADSRKKTLSTVNSQKLMVKLPLAWILDNLCGLKGYQKGTLALFERQPIVLVNTGGASAQEIEAFAEAITSRVREKTGIEIQWEVEYLQ